MVLVFSSAGAMLSGADAVGGLAVSVRPSVRPWTIRKIPKAPRVFIRGQQNLAYRHIIWFSKNCRKRNFDFLPQSDFMGVQS